MGGTGLNLGGVKDAKSSENENDGGGDVTYSSVSPMDAVMQVVVRPPTLDQNNGPSGTTLTVQNNPQESALRSLGPVNQINRNETADNQLKAASDATTKIAVAGAQLEKISKMGDPSQTVAANMTPVTPAPSIPPPTMGGGSYTSTRKRDRSEETVWKPATFDATMAAVNFTAVPAQDTGLRTQLGQRLDLGTINGTKPSLDGMDTKGIGTRIAQTGTTLNSIQAVARMINSDAGRENKGPALAYKPPTPVSSGPSIPTGVV